MLRFFAFLAGLSLNGTTAKAVEFNVVAGLSQYLLLGGGNAEIDIVTENWVFEYSHGWGLDFARNDRIAQTKAERDQDLDVYMPYTTGGGVGYRLTKALNARLELKEHDQIVENFKTGEKIRYLVRTVGVGFYYEWQPFGKGLLIVPNIRYWPTVSTSLDEDQYVWSNGEIHEAHAQGLIINCSVGWKI